MTEADKQQVKVVLVDKLNAVVSLVLGDTTYTARLGAGEMIRVQAAFGVPDDEDFLKAFFNHLGSLKKATLAIQIAMEYGKHKLTDEQAQTVLTQATTTGIALFFGTCLHWAMPAKKREAADPKASPSPGSPSSETPSEQA